MEHENNTATAAGAAAAAAGDHHESQSIEMKELKPKNNTTKSLNGTGMNFMYICKNLDVDDYYAHDNYLESIKKKLNTSEYVESIRVYVEEVPAIFSDGGSAESSGPMCCAGLGTFSAFVPAPELENAKDKFYHALVVVKVADGSFIAFDKGNHLYIHVATEAEKLLKKYVGDRAGLEENCENINLLLSKSTKPETTLYDVVTWIDSMKWAIKGYSLIQSSCQEFAREILLEFATDIA
ncbi:uncharacterized protein LOC141914065 [Tubulanus polymorphus]|uniref:uncharacterized protein LOC141914065 n=1 Tax=Tubulanus polymorphus TaxID=672921 RepID=UPI003DA5593E